MGYRYRYRYRNRYRAPTPKPAANLPDDIIHYNILTRLPTRSLFRFKCVSKDWYALINPSSTTFINLHLNYLNESRDSLIICKDYRYDNKTFFFTYLNAPRCISPKDFVFKTVCGYSDIIIWGSANGLICYLLTDDSVSNLILCNPLTRECCTLIDPPPPDPKRCPYSSLHGFGYDTINCNYKIVKIFFHKMYTVYSEVWAEIFNTSTNSWKRFENDKVFDGAMLACSLRDSGVSVNNTLHWHFSRVINTEYINCILTFDLDTEKFGEMSYPIKFNGHEYIHVSNKDEHHLMASNGCLYAIANNKRKGYRSIWVMKKYGVPETWTEIYRLVGDHLGLVESEVITYRSTRKGGEVLLVKHVDQGTDELMWYSLKGGLITPVKIPGKKVKRKYHGYAGVCIGSLAPIPGIDQS